MFVALSGGFLISALLAAGCCCFFQPSAASPLLRFLPFRLVSSRFFFLFLLLRPSLLCRAVPFLLCFCRYTGGRIVLPPSPPPATRHPPPTTDHRLPATGHAAGGASGVRVDEADRQSFGRRADDGGASLTAIALYTCSLSTAITLHIDGNCTLYTLVIDGNYGPSSFIHTRGLLLAFFSFLFSLPLLFFSFFPSFSSYYMHAAASQHN